MPQEHLRSRFSQYLASALGRYESFLNGKAPPDDPKDFAVHQSACRAALSHIDLLFKLVRRAETEDGGAPRQDGVPARDLIARAEAAVQRISTASP